MIPLQTNHLKCPWRPLDALRSRGSQADKAGSLAGLHQARERTLSQFFTPAWVVDVIWSVISPSFLDGERYSLLDNSLGAASLFRYASPDIHTLSGLDIDGELLAEVSNILEASGFSLDIQHAAMERARLGHYSAALINPPFSIPLSGPTLEPYPGVTHYGRHGPHSSALSHEYAIAQALAHADIVAAIVPRSTTARLTLFANTRQRLRAIYQLPSNTFQGEQVASVAVDLLVFGPEASKYAVVTGSVAPGVSPSPLPDLACRSIGDLEHRSIQVIGTESSRPVITRPVTGDPRVQLVMAGRSIKLVFHCGATEGRVLNALYRNRLFSSREHRYPPKTHYAGQLMLSMDILVLQEDPFAALDMLFDRIKAAGGYPDVSPGIRKGLQRMIEEHARMTVPYGRTVYRKGTPSFEATARRMAMLNRQEPGAAVAAGETVTATRTEQGFSVTTCRGAFTCDHDHFFELFEAEASAVGSGYWEEIYPPIRTRFQAEIEAIESKARDLGLDRWLTWDFQVEDLCELAFRPHGGICGWQMALGKSRLALALAQLLEGPSLLVLRSRLVDEMEREIRTLGLTKDDYQIIETATGARNPKKINIISYETLRRAVDRKHPKLTYARLLKGRVYNVLADEGGLLANEYTQQTAALWQIRARKRYILDGTPFPNYVREALPLAAWCVGQERSYQPYSLRGGYLEERLFTSARFQKTGRQAFLDHFVCFDWATNEFLDSGVGAKREIPKINPRHLLRFQAWFAPLVKRRVQQEPAVQKHVRFPIPTLHEPVRIPWKLEHLLLYISAVEDFNTWYQKQVDADANDGGRRRHNLTMILARLEACFKAANAARSVKGFATPYQGLTSKDEICIDMVRDMVSQGRRPIVFARNHSVLHRLSKELEKYGISSLVFTGKERIKKRLAKLNAGIREGDVQVLLASIGVTQDGLNLPEINTFFFYNRSWKVREEFQAIYRLIRPQQKSDVFGHFLHLEGSIDEYMGQLMNWKSLASEAGLDYGEQPNNDEFVHFDAFIYRFLESLPALKEQVKHLRQRSGMAA